MKNDKIKRKLDKMFFICGFTCEKINKHFVYTNDKYCVKNIKVKNNIVTATVNDVDNIQLLLIGLPKNIITTCDESIQESHDMFEEFHKYESQESMMSLYKSMAGDARYYNDEPIYLTDGIYLCSDGTMYE